MAGRARKTNFPASTQLGDLPEAEVACILQHIPLKERLTCCALVCTSWAAAAAAALAAVTSCFGGDAERAKRLQAWLGKHGGVVTKLTAMGCELTMPGLQLPVSKLTKLQYLHLWGVKTQLLEYLVSTRSSGSRRRNSALTGPSSSSAAAGSSGSAAASVAVLPQLQELNLRSCNLTAQLASQLLSATTLTSVQWHSVQLHKQNQAKLQPQQQVLLLLWQRLQQLPKLSTLKLGGVLTAADFNPMSSLGGLQHLGVCLLLNTNACAAAVAAAPVGLTALDLQAGPPLFQRMLDYDPDEETEVCLSMFSQLLRFRGTLIRMPLATLGGLTGLRELRLVEPLNPTATSICSPEKILATLQHLTQLRHLEMGGCRLVMVKRQPQQQQGAASGHQCFSALTASTQLTALILREKYNVPVPPAAYMHIFTAGRVLPHLQVLRFECMEGFQPLHLIAAKEVTRIAAACPALQQLTLRHVCNLQQLHRDSSCLLQLPPGVTQIEGLSWTRPQQ